MNREAQLGEDVPAVGSEWRGAPAASSAGNGRVAEGSAQARRGRRVRDWRRVLSAASPREVLARLMRGDPLRLAVRVQARLRARAFLLDADRVFLRAAARCARFAVRYRGEPSIEAWLDERVDEAIGDLLEAEREGLRLGLAPEPASLQVFESLARPLGLDPVRAQRACVAHNLLDEVQRRTFRELVIEGRSVDELAVAAGCSASQVARAARAALDALTGELDRMETREGGA